MKYLVNGFEMLLALFMGFSILWMMAELRFDFSGENGVIFILFILPAIIYSFIYGLLRWQYSRTQKKLYRYISAVMVCIYPFAVFAVTYL